MSKLTSWKPFLPPANLPVQPRRDRDLTERTAEARSTVRVFTWAKSDVVAKLPFLDYCHSPVSTNVLSRRDVTGPPFVATLEFSKEMTLKKEIVKTVSRREPETPGRQRGPRNPDSLHTHLLLFPFHHFLRKSL